MHWDLFSIQMLGTNIDVKSQPERPVLQILLIKTGLLLPHLSGARGQNDTRRLGERGRGFLPSRAFLFIRKVSQEIKSNKTG